jgi:hypothetical protein
VSLFWLLWDLPPQGPVEAATLDYDDLRACPLDLDDVRSFSMEVDVSTTQNVQLPQTNISSVDTVEITLSKDGAAWTGADAVTLTFLAPDGTLFSRTMGLYDSATARWRYTTTTSDMVQAGEWRLSVTVTAGGVTKTYPYEIYWEVTNQP